MPPLAQADANRLGKVAHSQTWKLRQALHARYPDPVLAALALGSNLPSRFGSPADNLREALHRLADLGSVTAVSSSYETDPVGFLEQPRFTNAAALLQTDLGPLDLLRALLAIEAAMGRQRNADQPPKGPRLIDLDLLLCYHRLQAGEELGAKATQLPGAGATQTPDSDPIQLPGLILADPDLILPHPQLHVRRFVLEPLAEIAPNLLHPVLNRTIRALLDSLSNAPQD